MASVSVEIKGNTSFLDRILQRVGVNAPRVTMDIAQDIRDDIRSNWSGNFPPASRPGEPPAKRSGTLDLSVVAIAEENLRNGKIVTLVQAGAPYASHLEYDTYKMAARPFMRPAIKRAQKTFAGRWKALFRE